MIASLSRLLRRGSCASSLPLRRNPRNSVVAPSIFLFCRQLTNGSKGNDEALIKWLSGHTIDTTNDQIKKQGRPRVSRRTNDSDTRFLFDLNNDNPTQTQVDTYFLEKTDLSLEDVISILLCAVNWKKKKSIDVLTGDKLGIIMSSLQRGFSNPNKHQLRHSTVGIMECLQVISPTDIEESGILGVVTELLKSSLERKVPFTAIDISRMLYGLQNLNSDNPEVRDMLPVLVNVVNNCDKNFTAQAVGNALYGLQGMNSEHPQVLSLLVVLTDKVKDCDEPLSAQAVGNALYALQSMNSKHEEVRKLLVALTDKFKASNEKLNAQAVSIALYGLQGMSSEHREVRALLVVLTEKAKDCVEKFNDQHVGNALYGLQGMSSNYPEVRALLVALTDKLKTCKHKLTAQAVGNALYGLQGMNSEHPEVRSLVLVLTGMIEGCDEKLATQEIGNAFYGLQGMSSEHNEVRLLLVALTSKLVHFHKLDAQAVSNSLYGLQGMSSEYLAVRSLLVVLTDKVEICEEPFNAQAVGNALYGLQYMNSDHPEVQKLLGALIDKIKASGEPLTVQNACNALYGLQGFDVDNESVRALLAALKDKVKICLEKTMRDHSTFEVLDLQRSFILCRHHIVAMFGSKILWSKYNSKLATELMQRRELQDTFFTTRANFQSKNEKTVYNRVVALAAELQITDVCHNVFLLDCFESDITFTAPNYKGAAVVVNVEVDGAHHERQQKKTFCRRRDEELQRQSIHVARISYITDTAMIDNFLRKTVAEVLARQP